MFKELINTNKYLTAVSAIVVMSALSACGPTAEEKAMEERKNLGETLMSEIERATKSQDYQRVIVLCDSLDKACPDQQDLRKKALDAWTDARYHVLQDSAQILDSHIDSLTNRMSEMMPDFVNKDLNGLESYRIIKTIDKGNVTDATTVQPRLGNEDDLWTLVVNVKGSKPSITGLRLVTENNDITEVMAQRPEERRATETNGEMFTFSAEEAGPIAETLSIGNINKARLDIVGVKRTIPIQLNQTMIEAIIKTWKMAELREARQSVLKKRELTDRKLELIKSKL